MKNIFVLVFILISGALFSQASNTFKYVIKANGGIEVPVNTFKIGTIMVTRTGTQLNYVDIGSSLQGLLNAKIAAADTATMLGPYVNHNDTIALMEHYAKNTSVALKLAKTDTTAMLTPYINHNDTVAMLEHYAKLSGIQTITGTVLMLPKINENVEVTANSTEINILDNIEPNLIYIGDIAVLKADSNIYDGGYVTLTGIDDRSVDLSDVSIDISSVLNVQLSGALTDDAPTDSELDAVTGLTPATAGAGYHKTIRDTNGSALIYMIESDGTNWFYVKMTKAV
jgi:hypothetical protein